MRTGMTGCVAAFAAVCLLQRDRTVSKAMYDTYPVSPAR